MMDWKRKRAWGSIVSVMGWCWGCLGYPDPLPLETTGNSGTGTTMAGGVTTNVGTQSESLNGTTTAVESSSGTSTGGTTDASTVGTTDANTTGTTDANTTRTTDANTTGITDTSTAGTTDMTTAGTADMTTAGTADMTTAGTTDMTTAGTADMTTAGTADMTTGGSSGTDTDGIMDVPDFSGDFLLAVATPFDPTLPFQHIANFDYLPSGFGGGTVDVELQPLTLDTGSSTTPRTFFGPPMVFPDLPVAIDGTFAIPINIWAIAAETNPLFFLDMQANNVVFNAQSLDTDNLCGTATGITVFPIASPLDGSTFAAVRVADVMPPSLPVVFPVACP